MVLACDILEPEHSKAWVAFNAPISCFGQTTGWLLDGSHYGCPLSSHSSSCQIAAKTFSCSATCSSSSSTSSCKSSNISCSSSLSCSLSFKLNHCVKVASSAVTKPIRAAKIVPLSFPSFVLHLLILSSTHFPADYSSASQQNTFPRIFFHLLQIHSLSC